MGGKLTVVSQLGIGSTFTLHLPVAQSRREIPIDLPKQA
jgi:signal transduction histidine kinase